MLAEIPALFILAGLIAYTVLAGADFGTGFWTLVAGQGRAGRAAARAYARHAMGPVWEANHVWLIFILVVCWTAYPIAFASITSTLAAPLLLAAIGIILRGTSYAMRGQLDGARGVAAIENVFALSSMLTPFALGTVVGALATTGPDRQRPGRPGHQLAEPDLGGTGGARRRHLRVPGRGLLGRRRAPGRSAQPRAGLPHTGVAIGRSRGRRGAGEPGDRAP
jgi:cytochrome bd-type quinol oxidase subunit 2